MGDLDSRFLILHFSFSISHFSFRSPSPIFAHSN